MPTFKLKVSPAALDLGQAVLRVIFAIKRASVVDSFVIVPDLKRDVVVTDNEDFEVSLLPNTPGSVYEVVMFGTRTELMRAFFIMPAGDVFLHELNLLTAYPVVSGSGDGGTGGGSGATFLALSDTPNSYVGHAGKIVAVKQDESGLEFLSSEPEPLSCAGASDFFGFQELTGLYRVFVDGVDHGASNPPTDIFRNLFSGVIDVENDGFADFWNLETTPHRIWLVPEGDGPHVMTPRIYNQMSNESYMSYPDGSGGFCLAAAEEMNCPNGYKRSMNIFTSVGTDGNMVEIQNGDTVYIPIALTPDGPSITSPFIVNADLSGVDPDVYWLRIGNNIVQHLAEQLNPYGLSATWSNNFKEFGITDDNKVATAAENIEFYILDEGNTYPAEQMPRGLVPASCWMAT